MGKEVDAKNEAITKHEAEFAGSHGAVLHSRVAGRRLRPALSTRFLVDRESCCVSVATM
jgi:hypothetical protein